MCGINQKNEHNVPHTLHNLFIILPPVTLPKKDAMITKGKFYHGRLRNFEAYHGKALVDCYLKEGNIKCCGTFLDNRLVQYSDVFFTSKFGNDVSFVHLMQHLDDVSFPFVQYPISGEDLMATGMEYWVAYLIRYLSIVYKNANDTSLPSEVRAKYLMTWEMIAKRHDGLLRRLVLSNFIASDVIQMDWSEAEMRIGTDDGAWG